MVSGERMQADDRKADILASVLPLFAMKGFAATTTKDLAKAAKVSEGLLYKHFPGKESMYRELGIRLCGGSEGVSAELARMPPSTKGLVQVLYYLTRIILIGPMGSGQMHEFLLRMMCRSLLEDGLFAKEFMEAAFLPYLKPMEAMFAAARKEGNLHTGAKSDIFAVFFSHHMVVGVKLHALRTDSHLDAAGNAETRFREMVMFNLRGAGLKDEAIRKHLDFKKLDKWYAEAFNLGRRAPDGEE